MLQGFCVIYWLDFPLPKLPFVGFLERGELKKNFGVGSVYLRAKKKRVALRPTGWSFSDVLSEGQHSTDSSGIQ